jgi:hypothetical protein
MGFSWAPTPQEAFEAALGQVGGEPAIAVLEGAARMLVLKDQTASQAYRNRTLYETHGVCAAPGRPEAGSPREGG